MKLSQNDAIIKLIITKKNFNYHNIAFNPFNIPSKVIMHLYL